MVSQKMQAVRAEPLRVSFWLSCLQGAHVRLRLPCSPLTPSDRARRSASFPRKRPGGSDRLVRFLPYLRLCLRHASSNRAQETGCALLPCALFLPARRKRKPPPFGDGFVLLSGLLHASSVTRCRRPSVPARRNTTPAPQPLPHVRAPAASAAARADSA